MEGFARWGLCFIRKSIGLVNPFSAIYPWLMKLTHHTSFSPFPFDVFDFVIGMNTRGPHAIHTFMPRKWNLLNKTLVFSIFQQNETASHLTCITHQESDAVWFPKLTNTKGRNRHFLAGNKSWKRSRTTNFFQHFGVTKLGCWEASMIFCLNVESTPCLFIFLPSSIELSLKEKGWIP